MGVVAVAGGTGGFGKTVVEQLALSGKHDIVVFSRTAPAEQAKDGPKFISADYTNLDSLIKILESQNIDTVISTIGLHNEATEKAQLNLIEAAKRSSKTKRFIPSEFGAMNTPEFAKIEPYANVWLRAADALKASGLEYTRLINGFFLDYWGMPYIKTYMPKYKFAFDMENYKAAIPGTGNEPLTVTYTVDVSRFIVRALDDKDWPEFSIIAGSDITLNEALAKVEKVRGKKFNVTYDSEEKLKNNQSTVLSGYEGVAPDEAQWLDSMMGRMIIGGWLSMPKENRISEKHPDIIPLTVDELLAKYWGAKSN
ncbi:nmrA-like family protein [Colletotrichum higginsianum]|nr:nmrA-like family protein [Colletotrichum higginsianum]